VETLLITGAYGTGKSTLAGAIGDELERRRLRYAAIDLDWLMWFDPGDAPDGGRATFLANVAAVVRNYRAAGIERYVLAGSVDDASELDALREAVGMPVRVLRLTVPMEVIDRRLERDDRPADAIVAQDQVHRELGATIAERTVDNDRPIADAVADALDWVGWR
jgi:thymidylate kinase